MKTKPRAQRHRHELLREFFACAVVIAAIKSGQPLTGVSLKSPLGPSPAGRV
jgi:hypothetical protein